MKARSLLAKRKYNREELNPADIGRVLSVRYLYIGRIFQSCMFKTKASYRQENK